MKVGFCQVKLTWKKFLEGKVLNIVEVIFLDAERFVANVDRQKQ